MERANQRPLIIWLLQWLVCSGTIAQDSETCVYKQTLTPYSGEWFRFWQVGASPCKQRWAELLIFGGNTFTHVFFNMEVVGETMQQSATVARGSASTRC